MVKGLMLGALLVTASAAAHADLLEVSGFGGYTSLAMKQANSSLNDVKNKPGLDQTKTTEFSNGYVVGLDVRSGALIPIPFFEVGLRGEYVGANPAEIQGTWTGQAYDVKENASMVDAMLGLDFGIGIPGTGLNLGLSAYGGYGEGAIEQSSTLGSIAVSDPYSGGAFVGEAEAKVGYKIFSVLSLYGFGGMRFADLGIFEDPAKHKFNPSGSGGAPEVDFSGYTGGLGLNLDF